MNATATPPAVDIDTRWQDFAPDLPADKVLFSDVIPGGCHWSWVLPRGTALRFTSLGSRPASLINRIRVL